MLSICRIKLSVLRHLWTLCIALLISVNLSADNKELLQHGKENYYYAAGIRFNKFHINDGLLYTIDGFSNQILIIDANSGKILETFQTIVPIPDDLDIGPDTKVDSAGIKRGTIYYTVAGGFGGIGRIRPDGNQDVIFGDPLSSPFLPNTNGISFSPDGKHLYISQVFHPGNNGVFEVLDFHHRNPAVPSLRTILPNIDSFGGGLEGFVTAKENNTIFIYGPLWYEGTLVKIDPSNGATTIVPSTQKILYGGSHTSFDDKGRLLASDLTGRLIRINNFETGCTEVLNRKFTIDTVFNNSKGKIYLSRGQLGDIIKLKKNHQNKFIEPRFRKKNIIEPGFNVTIGLTVLDQKLFVGDIFSWGVYSKKNGKLQKLVHQKDWLHSAKNFNFFTQFNTFALAPMNNHMLLACGVTPTGRLAIFDVSCLDNIKILTEGGNGPILLGTQVPTGAIALDDHTLIVCGADEANPLAPVPFVEKITLTSNFSIASIVPIPITGLEFPIGLAQSQDGSTVWVSDYVAKTIFEIDIATSSVSTLATDLVTPQTIALTKDGKFLLFLEEETKSLKAIHLKNPTPPFRVVADKLGSLNINKVGVRDFPSGIFSCVSVDPDTGEIYVAASGAKKLWKIKF